jgi:hypothetical protein
MKTNFLKTSLSAFAFALAIMVSFAFSPALNSTDTATAVDGATQNMGNKYTPCADSRDDCFVGTANDCTVGMSTPVYQEVSGPGEIQCTQRLSFTP